MLSTLLEADLISRDPLRIWLTPLTTSPCLEGIVPPCPAEETSQLLSAEAQLLMGLSEDCEGLRRSMPQLRSHLHLCFLHDFIGRAQLGVR
jgi:hypothetical protein